jgi:hypothetical protein
MTPPLKPLCSYVASSGGVHEGIMLGQTVRLHHSLRIQMISSPLPLPNPLGLFVTSV